MIEVKSVSMRYGSFLALDQVSFEAREGKILGLLGPNGAGKTTIMRILTTYLFPYQGTAVIGGYDILQNPIQARHITGYLPETAPLYQDMRVDEYLVFVGRARKIAGKSLAERLDWVKDSCGLKPIWKHNILEISKGYKQRVGLAQALIHDPKVLILDEPTSGLDPLQIIGIRDLIRNLAQKKTIIFSTHILPEVEALADQIVIISGGKLVVEGSREDLISKIQGQTEIRFIVQAPQSEVEQELKNISSIQEFHYQGKNQQGFEIFQIFSKKGVAPGPEIDRLTKKKNWVMAELAPKEISLEEVFISLLNQQEKRS